MSGEEKFCLKWNDFQNNISKAFKELKDDEDFFDVTLACEGNSLKAHKVILSACSPFFKSVLKLNKHAHPLIYLKGVKYEEMCSVIDFMYYGEVSVAQVDLTSFLLVAEELQVRGLSQSGQENTFSREAMSMTKKSFPDPAAYNVPTKPFKLPEINSSFSQAIPSEVNDSVIAVERTESIVVDVECDPLLTDEQHLEDDDQIAVPEEEDLVNHHNYQEQIRHMGHITNNGQGWNAPETPDVFSCTMCDKKYTKKKSLQNHMTSHKGMTYCPICDKNLSSPTYLRSHMVQVHKQQAPAPVIFH